MKVERAFVEVVVVVLDVTLKKCNSHSRYCYWVGMTAF